MEIFQRIHDRHAPTTLLAWDPDQDLVAVLEMSMATNKVGAIECVAVIAGLLSGVVVQNHC